MSAFAEFSKEKQAVDAYLEQGFIMAAIFEDLDGARLRFKKESEQAELRLFTADARKYAVSLMIGGSPGA
ncbi:hypothetical protein LJK88_17815 [Paenibacillus sp. P26]|nr:hypothetical protein LJK88_17815 [Paenibacillus sp. P26]UUZ96389.1 hypothetical protein LJK87_19980 [Paenibacillus sp. P25]